MNTYLDLCTEYYELDKPFAAKEALDFYLKYATQVNGAILEPMCGTGRFLIPFIEAGHQIEGFDTSEPMLKVLIQKCKAKNLSPNVWCAYLQDLNKNNCYHLIFIPSGSFGLITNEEDAKNCLIKIRNALSDNGTFVFEIETLNAIPSEFGIWKGAVRIKDENTKIINNAIDFPPVENVGETLCKYELVQKNTIIKTEIESYKIRLYDPNELRKILSDVGFSEIKFIKAFDHNKTPDPNDALIVVECRK